MRKNFSKLLSASEFNHQNMTISDYLLHRKQYVVARDYDSRMNLIKYGVLKHSIFVMRFSEDPDAERC